MKIEKIKRGMLLKGDCAVALDGVIISFGEKEIVFSFEKGKMLLRDGDISFREFFFPDDSVCNIFKLEK